MDRGNSAAFRFIVYLGIVSLFGDITYEGVRSITGPYLAFLGATAGVVGLVSGLGEFAGYALRMLSGYLADKTRAYWPLTIAGYALILSIPMLAFANSWQVAGLFIVLERMGKAIRTPARDAILSHATKKVGRGIGFGLHEALDQVGAVLGPLIFTAAFLLGGTYRHGFAVLWIPGMLAIAFLFLAKSKVPEPEKLESPGLSPESEKIPKIFWAYIVFSVFSIAGFANFQIISFHFKFKSVFSDAYIPALYMLAMAVDAVFALIIGKTYDKIGLRTLLAVPVLCVPLPLLAFSTTAIHAVSSVVLWGAVMGIHETIMRAAIADLTPLKRRGFVYGIFNAAYGISGLIGGIIMGLLYGIGTSYLIFFAVAMQIASAFFLICVFRLQKSHR